LRPQQAGKDSCVAEPWLDAMPRQSAGILMYRVRDGAPQVLLVHPGGPYWASKDDGAWGLPKGEYAAGEDPLDAARREFEEETGLPPSGDFVPLGAFVQSKAKTVQVWAVEGDFDPSQLRSNLFSMEWPPKSGRMAEYPEADRAGWFGREAAARKILKGQLPILEALFDRLAKARGST
jgi:predicted NUDIX family NTP pyrophosphohydrolase